MMTTEPLDTLQAAPGQRLAGKVAIVTGAGCVGPGWGNGRAIAVRFAQEGAKVIAVDRDLASMQDTLAMAEQIGVQIWPMVCDVTSETEIEALFAEIKAAHGRLDVLINNVGGPAPGGAAQLEPSAWEQQIELNLTTVFRMTRHAVAAMKCDGGGVIINIASTSAIRWTGAAQIGYAAAKGGVVQFGRVAAVELASRRIRVNNILPGQLHTPLVDAVLAGSQANGDIDALIARRKRRIPLPFEADGRDTANAAVFLASDEARFITGADLVVDGGMSARCD